MSEQEPKTEETAQTSTSGRLMFCPPGGEWEDLKPVFPEGANADQKSQIKSKASDAIESLKSNLLSSLQMQHIAVLAGSGTSLGPVVKGPSMWSLWDYCLNENPGTGDETPRKRKVLAGEILEEIQYDLDSEGENIEALLSKCESYLEFKKSKNVSDFVIQSKSTILKMCSGFLDQNAQEQLSAHRTFIHRLSRRRTRDSRLKLFTTNYDLCFEKSAGRQGIVVLDGFSFTRPRYFDPRFFAYDIVRRPRNGEDMGTPLEGVFQIYKLHGSVNWARANDGEVEESENPSPESACMIYPAKGKYQQSYVQPHLELMSQYLSSLREPNTCLVVVGFGFNDDHLSEPILSAVKTNPHLRLLIANPSADDLSSGRIQEASKYWRIFKDLANKGEDVWFINGDFSVFSELIPDLRSLTPAQRIARDIKSIAESK